MRGQARLHLIGAAALAVALASCGGGDKAQPTTKSAALKAKPAPTMITVPSTPPEPDQPCDGRPGVDIPAVEIPEVRTQPVRVAARKLGDKAVPGFVIPGLVVPAQHVPAQCAVVDPAPAGCLGRVTIPSVTIPAVRIPEVRIPGIDVPGATVPAVVQPAVARPAVTVPSVVQEQVCAQKVRPGEYRPSVYRPAAYRKAAYREAAYREAAHRPSVCIKNDCIPAVDIPAVNVPPVAVQPVNVQPEVLQGRNLPEVRSKCVSVFADQKTAAYQVCADVLFAFDRSDIRPSAERILREVAKSIEQRYRNADIQVDGHTDAKGSPQYNQGLSERRANAVADWLADHEGIDRSRMKVQGYGETQPVAPNTKPDGSDNPAGRKKNRRVVIGVTRR
jgi:outer membrane protein OmpA-like peptidoglycan-associated protein